MASTSTRTKTTPARADGVNYETGQTADEVKTLFTATATGRGGRTNTRKTGTVQMGWAVDVADREARSSHLQTGAVWSFHPTKELAEKQAEKWNAKPNLDAVVVQATSAPLT